MTSERSNRLMGEQSPYLLQHAYNPVDWHPWGEEAFEKARQEQKPIFLSVGYSTCHWCHVMERESFENPEIAALMNAHYVNVKVDREERPDVDRIYMAFVQATTGGGGWPMSVWLTPDLRPFVGGTYFPPADRGSHPGFPSVLQRIAEAWRDDREKLLASSVQVTEALKRAVGNDGAPRADLPTGAIQRALDQFSVSFDEDEGGFGPAPKFPRPSVFEFLFRVHAEAPDRKQALEMALFTLRKMSAGGMHDHLGGGFHRYSVDARWHVPHFEKMLYDQAQLAGALVSAFQITGENEYAAIARDVLDYVTRDLCHPGGGFLTAEDADSAVAAGDAEKMEGAFYVWTASEIEAALGIAEARLFNAVYGVEPAGNVSPSSDPQGELGGKNILFRKLSNDEAAAHFGITPADVESRLADSRRKLFERREQRPRPHLDDKIITAWNGLMISAFARAGSVFDVPDYVAAATRAAQFIREQLFREADGTLLRVFRESAGSVEGFADDYAFLIQGLLDLYEASFETQWIEWALTLQQKQDELFLDQNAGGYFSTSGFDTNVLIRMKEDHDGAEPSPNSVAALNLFHLGALLDRPDLHERGLDVIRAFSDRLQATAFALPQMLVAVDWAAKTPKQIVIAGPPEAAETWALLREVRTAFLPHKVVILADGGEGQAFFARHVDFMAGAVPVNGRPAAYVCQSFTCQLPVTEPEKLAGLLK